MLGVLRIASVRLSPRRNARDAMIGVPPAVNLTFHAMAKLKLSALGWK